MKKFVICILVVALVLSFALFAMGCDTKDANGLIKLKTPKNLVVSGDAISWSSVKNAKRYYVNVEGVDYESTTNTFVVPVKEKGIYKLKVKAYGDGIKYGESDYSKEVEYAQNERLESPRLTINGNVLSWIAIEGAEKYNIIIKNRDGKQVGGEILTEATEYVFEGELYAKPNIYTAYVVAMPIADSKEYIKSLESKSDYIVSVKLATPEFITFATSDTKIKWNSVEYSSKYKLKITNKDGISHETEETLYENINFADLGIKEAGVYTLQVKAVGDGNVFLDSDYSEIKPEFTLNKLNQVNKEEIKIEYSEDKDEYLLIWSISKKMFPDFTDTKIFLKAKNAEGKEILGAVSVTIKKDKTEAEKEGASVEITGEEGEEIYTYTYPLDNAFIIKSIDTGEWEYKKDDSYYGKFYDVYLQVENVDISNRYLSADSVEHHTKYLSYQRPNVLDDGFGFANIEKVGEFAFMTQHLKNKNESYKIITNLDFDNYIIPTMQEFYGTFEGGEYILKNAIIDGKLIKNEKFGIFGINNGEIRNLNLVNVKISAQNSRYVGMVGQNDGIIRDCLVDGVVEGANGIVGAIAGKNTNLIEGCQSNANVSGLIVGGICGVNISETKVVGSKNVKSRAQVANCTSNGKIEAKEMIVKDADGKELAAEDKVGIDKFLSGFDIEMLAGGLIGFNKGFVFEPIVGQGYPACSDGTSSVACSHGFIAPHEESVDYKAQVGTPASPDYSPQIGYPACSDGTTSVACSHGFNAPHEESVDYKAQVGTPASPDYSPQIGEVGDVKYIAEQNEPFITDASVYRSSSISNVSAFMGDKKNYIVSVGGLIGYNETSVRDSYAGKMFSFDIKTDNTISASGSGAFAGGFAGVNNGKINNCYASSSVLSGGLSGGFVALNKESGDIKNSFSISRSKSLDSKYRGFVVENNGAIEKCCYYSPFNVSGEVEGKVKKIEGENFEDKILAEVNADGVFGKMDKVRDTRQGDDVMKVQRGVYLCDIVYLETFKVTTRQNEGLSVYGYVVSKTNDPDLTKPQYKTIECVNTGSLDKLGDIVLRYPSGGVLSHNSIKVIVTVR